MNLLEITLPLTLAIIGAACAIGLSRSIQAAMEAMSRQPEAAGKIQTAMVIGCALIEALAIYALVVVLLLGEKI